MDDAGTEHESGWVLVDGSVVSAVGADAPPEADEVVDLAGALVTPGLVNTHHHLFQTLTRARAQEADLFTWLRELYPVWARLDDEAEYAAARAGLAELALSGCTTVFDHHYLFPRGATGLVEAEVQAARELGVRIIAARGSMDLGESQGGLPPDSVVEEADVVLAATEELAGRLHDEGAGAMVQIAVAPCSPFSVTKQLMAESAELARRLGLQLHTHLAETHEEETYCRQLYGCTPVEYLEELGWTASDVWCAHCVHLSAADVQTFSTAGVGVAHCPTSNLRLGAGVAPVRELVGAGVRVGLGVDGPASNERSDLFFEVKQALLVARGRGGPTAMTCREALRLATRGGAAVLGRRDIGSLEAGKCADLAIWRTDGLELGGAEDRVAGIVLSAPHRVDRLVVGGRDIVRDSQLLTAEEDTIAREHRQQARRFVL
jgi:cytosine/adenosine deaminase-related metal-dependent hydrolase